LTPEEIVRRVIEALEVAGVPYMLTGSLASSYHGIPRTTQDIDVVIAPTAEQLGPLLREFAGPEYYVGTSAPREALARRGQFNVIHSPSGWKIDFIMRKKRPFSDKEFERRMSVDLFGATLFITSAEDALVSKLEWAKLGESERQIEDAAGILSAQGEHLDRNYVEHWVSQLGLAEQWAKTRRRSGFTRP
jgi:hypothetical protein